MVLFFAPSVVRSASRVLSHRRVFLVHYVAIIIMMDIDGNLKTRAT